MRIHARASIAIGVLLFVVSFFLVVRAKAIDLNGLEHIAPVANYQRTGNGLILDASDGSQVQIFVIAPDLIRVRAAFRAKLPSRDHSWAIAKTDWTTPQFKVAENAGEILLSTDEVTVAVHRKPLLIEFRDAKTGKTINADERPMMFDPKTGRVAAAKKLGFDERFYGLGEKAARLDKRRGQFQMWNSDTPAYEEGTDPLYQSIPFYIGLENGTAYGIFFDNSYRTHFDFGSMNQEFSAFSADGGEMNYYFFAGPSMKKIVSRYADLTGHMPMPPMWALGNQQSRWSYYPASVAEEVVKTYRQHDLPLDALHLDIHYMNGYRVFTWDTNRFPDPKKFTEDLRREGVKVVTIVDPGVKYQNPVAGAQDATEKPELAPQDKSYYVFNQGLKNNFFLKRKDGSVYVGQVWPGKATFVDYTLPEARKWWGNLFRAYTEEGVAGIWTDMNEPSDFVDQSGKAKADVVSYDEGENSTQAKNRNVFALLMTRATREGLERLDPNKRPYIISRSGYAGIQRYSTMWTGDNTATWDALALSIPMFQTLGLSGEPFVGSDIGGFAGRTNAELLTRWYEVNFLAPMCRNHMSIDSYDHEPWRFGPYYENIIRKYLKLRYRLMPFLYDSMEEASRTGLPMFRPLVLNYQDDANTLSLDDEFMIGSDLLVAPILRPSEEQRYVYLPKGTWFDYWDGKQIQGGTMIMAQAPLDTVPMYVRAGSIVPMGPEMNYVGEKPSSPTFVIYPDGNGNASTSLYEDDGSTPAYKQGVFRRTSVTVSSDKGTTRIEVGAPEGTYDPGERVLTFVLKSKTNARSVEMDSNELERADSPSAAGWINAQDGVTVRSADDGKAHVFTIK
jgi:alpha-glucosidase